MINSTTKAPRNLKDGSVIPTGTKVSITFDRTRPFVALVTLPDGRTIHAKAIALMAWVKEFPRYTDADVTDAMYDGICPSLRGYDVEPDGWDEEGSPSILLALGVI